MVYLLSHQVNDEMSQVLKAHGASAYQHIELVFACCLWLHEVEGEATGGDDRHTGAAKEFCDPGH